ncbi:putative ATPase/DNA-binding CsgD family transcriptional regulator [Amycolatopsis bartoniae]|uniref:ATP-binding protein n=1 Tax=Amycolatopsis bartoniae TaxID=941986 RepID=UPI0011979108|nr:LuxR C-terminal-related transcriptional regulator [Amycolatopsis bartoniae]MBB2935359.1 putative ATPase/DNA-binding CsgD family transcriptional regulator [Amycolatopsis bartoniae]TVS99819.1 LuxR family transcriptional regulator [Amycolatopsis bartoniae]
MSGSPRTSGNLPAELTGFVGRREELGETKRLLTAARLVMLTGVAGVGKSRLAVRAGAGLRRAFPDGVWLVRLAGLTDPAALPAAVAAGLGLAESEVPARLRDSRLLLILDNCEQLVPACAAYATELLSQTENVRILATSTQLLRADGEQVLVVPPLPVTEDAVALFADRAAAAQPGFRLDAGNRDLVTRICRRLDGIPLAIELAAVRLRVLSPEQLLHRLDDRFGLLTTGHRTAAPRQRTLEAAIAWSFELCTPREQTVWAATSVLAGGFDLETAEAVCGDLAGEDVLDLVAALVDKSVLAREDGGAGHNAWYRMLETVREYGEVRLAESGWAAEVHARLLAYVRRLGRHFEAESFGPRQLEWLDRLRREYPNVRVALEHRGSPEISLALRDFWCASGLAAEGRRLLAAAPAHAGPERARALEAAAFLALQTAEPARAMLVELRELADETGDERAHAGYARCTGLARFLDGDLVSARARLEKALATYRRLDAGSEIFPTLVLLAGVAFFLDDAAGMKAAEEALALSETRRAEWSRGYALWAVALHELRRGDHLRASALLREAIALRTGDPAQLALAVDALAWCAEAAGLPERAAGLLGAARAAWRSAGWRIAGTTPYREFGEHCATRVRRVLDDRTFETAFDATAHGGADEVLAFALTEKTAPPSPGPAPRPGGLTRREREIAGLVAEGLSNREIAARLVIAQRTAETHVENILAKLGFSSRAQIAAWLTERRAAGAGTT